MLGDVMATLYLDNQLVGQTGWKPSNQRCWDQRFTFELERVRTVCTCTGKVTKRKLLIVADMMPS